MKEESIVLKTTANLIQPKYTEQESKVEMALLVEEKHLSSKSLVMEDSARTIIDNLAIYPSKIWSGTKVLAKILGSLEENSHQALMHKE